MKSKTNESSDELKNLNRGLSEQPDDEPGVADLGLPTAEQEWRYTRAWYAKGTRHVIVDGPEEYGLFGKEVVIVECPRRNLKTVRIQVDGRQMRYPIFWLRPIITEVMRKTLAERATRHQPISWNELAEVSKPARAVLPRP